MVSEDVMDIAAKKPELIYHYCPMETFSKIIESKQLWVTRSTKMNDIAEGEWITLSLQKYTQNPNVPQGDLDFCKDVLSLISKYSRHIYITSFSEDGDLLNQWKAYADDGKGISIGFQLNSFHTKVMEDRLEDWCCYDEYHVCKVQYLNYDDMENRIATKLKGWQDFSYAPQNIAMHFVRMRSSYKNHSFSQEREWRLIVEPNLLRDPEKHIWTSRRIPLEDIKTRVTSKGLSTYLTYPILGENQPQIGKIILGPCNQTREDDLDLFLYKNGLSGVTIEHSTSTYCG